MTRNKDYSVVPVELAVKAMRDNGYKNAAYAIAELMDNAIQADATRVELLCAEKVTLLDHRKRHRISKIAVIDNGRGMDKDTMRKALQFGNGTRLNDRTGMGRFGMGLPSSSISQCRRVDVWSWQGDHKKALHTYIDLDEICKGAMRDVPEPKRKPIPVPWSIVGGDYGESGTLVVWSELDRCIWKTAKSIMNNSKLVIGRMYRRFIDSGQATINMMSFLEDDPQGDYRDDYSVLPNDPMYLMSETSCPGPWDGAPMFEAYGDNHEVVVPIELEGGTKSEVLIRFSLAKRASREGHNPGQKPHGKHARKNIGVSVVRAGRELELDKGWTIEYDPVERWWGVEVEFMPDLDEVFGVTNNKQVARNFSDISKLDFKPEIRRLGSIRKLKEEMQEDNDPLGPLLEIKHLIESNLAELRPALNAQTRGVRSKGNKRHSPDDATQAATEAARKRQAEGHSGETDEQEKEPAEDRQRAIEEDLQNLGQDESNAKAIAARVIESGLRVVFLQADLEAPSFFSVRLKGGAILVTINMSHPAYTHLLGLLEPAPTDEEDPGVLRARLENALTGLKLVLGAWARYEDELPVGKLRDRAKQARYDWGSIARTFLDADSDDDDD